MPEEPIHGALTYRLALMAGFTQEDAGHLALATGGVDHHRTMRPCTWDLVPEILWGVFITAGGDRDPQGYYKYNPHESPETPDYVREWTNAMPDLPKLVQTVYYHYRDSQVAVRELERLVLRRSGAAHDGEADRTRYLNDLGVALHLVEDVGTPWAPGPHLGPPGGRFPVADTYIGHPETNSRDVGGRLIHMDPTISHKQDVPYNYPGLFRVELPEIYRFLVCARNAYYGHPDAAMGRRGPTGDQVHEFEENMRTVPVPRLVEEEIERAIALKTKSDARDYIADPSVYLLRYQARKLGLVPPEEKPAAAPATKPSGAARDRYQPSDMAAQYRRLSPADRAQVNKEVDDLFRQRTGNTAQLDWHHAADRPAAREWLRIRDEVMAKRVEEEVDLHGWPFGAREDYVNVGVRSYGEWIEMNVQTGILGTYQGESWTWTRADIDIAGYE